MIDVIKEYSRKGYISFHTPCHMGRNKYLNQVLLSSYDLTELEETDNLFSEKGCIKELEEKMAEGFSANAFYPLVNGATSGVMASLSLFKENDKIIVDRNCHISVINAIVKNKLSPIFIDTTLNDFNLPNPPGIEEIKAAYLKNPDVKGIFITNPNYYGMFCDLKEIIDFAKEKDIISIVDEAHGSHYYFLDKTKTASCFGADICILSFHKNLPALTQTGGILINNLSLKDKLKDNLRNYTSTSPSYLFMLSMDAMRLYMEKEGAKKLLEYYSYLEHMKKNLERKGVRILTGNDPFKFVINVRDADKKSKELKEKKRIVPEMCDSENVTYIISIHNYKKEIELLKKGAEEYLKGDKPQKRNFALPERVMLPHIAKELSWEEVPLNKAEGRVSYETLINFPPSVPIVVAGERIEKEALEFLDKSTVKCINEEFVK